MDEANPNISVEYAQNAAFVTINCERILEDVDIMGLEDSLIPFVQEQDRLSLVIDFRKVKYLSSAMLGLLIRISKEITDRNGQLRLCCINDKLLGIFKITRLDKVFVISHDREHALASFD